MSGVNIIQNENSPALNLITQINQVKDQAREHAKFDLDGINFDGEKSTKSDEIKLFIPVEKFSDYKNNKKDTVSLMCFFIVIIAIICYLHRTR